VPIPVLEALREAKLDGQQVISPWWTKIPALSWAEWLAAQEGIVVANS
jgi:hypothetical protein